MSIPAGWYPDPQQQDQLRYWDGSAWTEHQTPAQATGPTTTPQEQTGGYGAASAPATPASPTSASAGYGAAPAPGTADQTSPYGSLTESDPATQGYGGPGYSAPQQSGFGPASPGAEYAAGYPAAGPPPEQKPNRTPLIVGGIVGAVVVVGLILLGVNLISGGDEPPPTTEPTTVEPTDDPTDEPTDDPTDDPSGGTDAGTLAVGSSVDVAIPADGTANVTLTVDQTQVVRLYTSSSDVDPVLSVLDGAGAELAEDDDTEYNSSNPYDASVQVSLQAGEYTIALREWSGNEAQVSLTAETVGEATALELGESEFEVPADGLFVGTVQVEPGNYAINIVSDEDPTLEVTLPGGEIEENDDRDTDAPDQDNIFDPYLEVTVSEAGELTLMIEEYGGDQFNGRITIEQQ